MRELYALCRASGVPGAEVDGMDPDDMADLTNHWANLPPPHIAVRRLENVIRCALGGKPDLPAPKLATRETVRALIAQMGQRG